MLWLLSIEELRTLNIMEGTHMFRMHVENWLKFMNYFVRVLNTVSSVTRIPRL